MPSDVAGLDSSDFALNLLVASLGVEEDNRRVEKMNRKASQSGKRR